MIQAMVMAHPNRAGMIVTLVKALAVLQGTGLLTGCAAAFGQTDTFPEKLQQGCKTEQECQRLVTEADARVSRCKDNTIGYIRCSDAQADQKIAIGYLREHQQKHESEEKKRLDDRHQRQVDEAERQRVARQSAKDQEAADRQSRVDERKSEAASVWKAIETDKCSKQGDVATCAALEEYSNAYSDQSHASEARVFARMGREISRQRAESHEASTEAATPRAAQTSSKPKHAKCCDNSIDEKCACSGGAGCCFQRGGVCGCE